MRSIQPTVIRYSTDAGLYSFMLSIYRYMGLGLALTGLVALGYGRLPRETLKSLSFVPLLGILGVFGISFSMSFLQQRLRAGTIQALFWVFSACMGLTISGFLARYTPASLGGVFLVTAASFGGLSVYANVTRTDLSSVGSFAIMGLIGLCVASFVNVFLKSSGLSFALSIISVGVFSLLIAYDTQRLKDIYYQLPADAELRQKMSIFGALNLYSSTLNLFLSLLQIFGEQRRDR